MSRINLREEYLNRLLSEANQSPNDAKASLINLIASYFQKYSSDKSFKSDRGLLFLIAALTILNSTEGTQAVSMARRLAQLAWKRTGN